MLHACNARCIGTTSVFPYIAAPVGWSSKMGKPTVEINPGTSSVSHLVEAKLALGAADALEEIWQRYLTESEDKS